MKISINPRIVFKILIIFLYFPPVLFERLNAGIEIYFDIATIILTVIGIFDFVINDQMVGGFEIILFIFFLYSFTICIINSPHNIYQFFTMTGYPIVSGYFISSYLVRNDYDESVDAFGIYFSLLIIANMILMLLYPSGVMMSGEGAVHIRANWLFGSKNNIVQHIPIMLSFIVLSLRKSNFRIWNIIVILCFIIEIICMGETGFNFMDGSTTALFVLVAMLFTYSMRMIPFVRKLLNFFSFSRQLIFTIVLTGLLAFVSLFNRSNALISNILSLFGKNTSFSYRDATWVILLDNIARHMMTGVGFKVDIYTYSYIGGILLRYGAIGLFLLYLTLRSADYYSLGNKDLDYFRIALFGTLIGGLMNEVTYRDLIIIITFCKCGAFWGSESEGEYAILADKD